MDMKISSHFHLRDQIVLAGLHGGVEKEDEGRSWLPVESEKRNSVANLDDRVHFRPQGWNPAQEEEDRDYPSMKSNHSSVDSSSGRAGPAPDVPTLR